MATTGVACTYDQFADRPEYLNTPRLVADDTQTTVWKWEQQEPFGVNAANDDPDGNSVAFEFNLRFPGQYFDKETGLHYNGERDYDSAIGRYVQSDPIGITGELDLYPYVRSSPLGLSDPTGEFAVPIGVGTIAAVAVGVYVLVKIQEAITQRYVDVPVSGAGTSSQSTNAADCQDEKPCDPPEGTHCFAGPHDHAQNYPQLKGARKHYHIYVMQRERVTRKCKWKRDTKTFGKGAAVLEPLASMMRCPPGVGGND